MLPEPDTSTVRLAAGKPDDGELEPPSEGRPFVAWQLVSRKRRKSREHTYPILHIESAPGFLR